MCKGSVTANTVRHTRPASPPTRFKSKPTAFSARRLTPSTFLIVEVDDVYDEHPFIYAKLVSAANTILLLDTGCGGKSNDPEVGVTSLREFVETVPIDDNGGEPLNPGGRMHYVVVLSHCHYDHILGVEQFAHDSPVLVSGNDPLFLAPDKLPTHSLCDNLGIRTPVYRPSFRPHLDQILSNDEKPLGVTLLHTPGHVPDELGLWDEEEAMLYVGDTLYEWAPIIFPNEGSIVEWFKTIDDLTTFVETSGKSDKAKVNCGHKTAEGPALEVLQTTRAFMMDVIEGREEVKSRTTKRGEEHVEYVQAGGRYSLICPTRLVREAKYALSA
ncbi:Metallo-hydrolase/oxidoreductase [Dichomitus squalens LYAD-421 SS1]|uniref:Metallo-hydrolase/oxidoreductase n=1 Tax=Dichomitus squalens TaxID=114155 RepID=A0A4Q9Q7W5_9APHY|nr:Metallo-hydrolase/oxidoreductase [Dichomitus squalens LYAD-421 SS1]EJF64647.1 Metallo-hydrolase/oxidoreductase [Dichomitus squalens LYAD-421 SS1]TBU63081.1 Metallo-hydrolase/oxidoreductase [Dichomitus squalens]